MQKPLRWQLFDEAQRHLTAKGSEVATGTIVAHRHRAVVDEVERAKNRSKPKVRASSLPSRKRGVEHSFGVIKRVFGFAKVRYKGLKKNTHRLLVTCALTNPFIARRYLLRCQQVKCVRNQAGKPCRHPNATPKPPIPYHRCLRKSLCPSSTRRPPVQTFPNSAASGVYDHRSATRRTVTVR